MSDDQESDREGRSSEGNERRRRGPLSDLTDEIERRRKRRDEAEIDDPFEDVSAESVDADAVWEQLSREDADPMAEASIGTSGAVAASSDTAVGAGDTRIGGGLDPQDIAGRDVRVVEKRSFCQGCRYLSDPPSVACTHEGTEILELVDTDHFRVVDCPMVAEAEALSDELRSDGSATE